MEFTAKIIADFLKGEIEGDPDVIVTGLSKIEEGKKGTLSFLANPKYEKYIYTTQASIVLVNKTFVPQEKVNATMIKVEDSYQCIASLLDLYVQSIPEKIGIDKLSFIDPTAKTGTDVYVGAFAFLGENVKIGNHVKIYPQVYLGDNVVVEDNSILYAGVKVYQDCHIGKDCIIHSGAVIGADGFGFAPSANNDYKKIPQVGNVEIEDHVEIGANTCIDRSTMGSTFVRKGVKLDNLIQIAHNVEVGENTVMASQTGVAGSTKVGKDCMIGGQVGISGHIFIGDGVKIGAQSGIESSIKDNEMLLGTPAMNIRKFQKSFVYFRKFPDVVKQIYDLQKEVEELKAKLDK